MHPCQLMIWFHIYLNTNGNQYTAVTGAAFHDDVIKWKYFLRYWSFVRGIHRLQVNSPHKGQWRGALIFSLICAWINGWVNNRDAGDLRRHRSHYDVTALWCRVMYASVGLINRTIGNTFQWNLNKNTIIFIHVWECRVQNSGRFVSVSIC